jgi:predicted choloylglycine hydrolase
LATFEPEIPDAAPLDRWARLDWARVDWARVDWADVGWADVGWADVDWADVDWASDWPLHLPPASAATAAWPAELAFPPARPAAAGSPTGVPPIPSPSSLLQIPVTVYGINEPTPGPRWKALFDTTWPAYRSWYLSEGDAARPDLAQATAMLTRHMPELLPTYRRLVELTGGDEVAARMLTMWDLPAFLPSCSQAVLTEPEPVLCRNYDYSPELWEATIYSSAFTGRKVIGTGDCLWGLLDGMNDAGLVVSLTFGGRPGSGPGFAIPLVVRYLLEVAETADQARELLRGLPIAMSYNITVVDAAGSSFTAFVAPDTEPEFFDAPIATNHRGELPEYPERANSLQSVPRLNRLAEVVAQQPTPDGLAAAFRAEPLYNRKYSKAFGTLYTALYRPKEQVVEYFWPDARWRRGFDDADDSRMVMLTGN